MAHLVNQNKHILFVYYLQLKIVCENGIDYWIIVMQKYMVRIGKLFHVQLGVSKETQAVFSRFCFFTVKFCYDTMLMI